jgi:ankyrin repeat protein
MHNDDDSNNERGNNFFRRMLGRGGRGGPNDPRMFEEELFEDLPVAFPANDNDVNDVEVDDDAGVDNGEFHDAVLEDFWDVGTVRHSNYNNHDHLPPDQNQHLPVIDRFDDGIDGRDLDARGARVRFGIPRQHPAAARTRSSSVGRNANIVDQFAEPPHGQEIIEANVVPAVAAAAASSSVMGRSWAVAEPVARRRPSSSGDVVAVAAVPDRRFDFYPPIAAMAARGAPPAAARAGGNNNPLHDDAFGIDQRRRRFMMAEHRRAARREYIRRDRRRGFAFGLDDGEDEDEAMMDFFEGMERMERMEDIERRERDMMEMERRERAALRGALARDANDVVRVPAGDNPRPLLRRRIGAPNPPDFGPDNNNNNNDNDPDPFRRRLDAIRARARSLPEPVSSYLFDMIRQDRTCCSVLSGWSQSSQNCEAVVQHCNDHPEEALYVSPQGRPAIHEACLRGACRHVIQALINANPSSVFERDNQGNTALHLLFVDFSSALSGVHSSIYGRPKDMDAVVGDLLAVPPPLNDVQNNGNDNQNQPPPGRVLASSSNRQGNTPLHMVCMAPAAIIDPNTIVQLLAASPTSATRFNNKNQTPLFLHCRHRNASTRIAELLLEAVGNGNAVNNNGRRLTANETFRRALEDGHIRGNPNNIIPEPNAPPPALTQLDRDDGWTPIHHAAANNNVELLRFMVEKYPEAVLVRTSKSQSALHLLCRQQQHNHHFLATASSNGNDTPVAGRGDLLAAVDLLLAADPASTMQQDTQSYTPLHLICKQGGFATAFSRSRDNRNSNNACGASSIDVVKRLLQAQPRAAALLDGEQYLPIHHACEVGCPPEIVQALLEANPASARAETRKHDTALSLSCTCNKSVESVKLLIKANPRALKQKNDYGFVPLHCICRAYQPRLGIVEALVDANPSCVHLQTNAGETATHLASSNSSAFVGILQLLTAKQKSVEPPPMQKRPPPSTDFENNGRGHLTSRIGNTPLHDACFRGSPFEHIETLAMANPEWISVHNNGGLSPLQILCKNGRLDERIIVTFANIGGSEIFAVVDENHNTPLHSAMREDTSVPAVRCLVRALPNAVHSKTVYGDSPLHLAIFRRASPEIVREVAMSASGSQASPTLEPNLSGQTPIGIAIEEFNSVCRSNSPGTCYVSCDYSPEQMRVFQVLATLVKILHYGPARCQNEDLNDLSLLHACVSLHRKGARLDPTFIRRAIHMYPGEVKMADEYGNYPLTIEAGIPVEKMVLLNGCQDGGCCSGQCNRRDGVLRILLEIYPDACKASNDDGHFPLGLMIQNGREWGHPIAMALQAFPPALHLYKGLDGRILPLLFEKASKECGTEVIYSLLSSRPDLLFEDPSDGPAVDLLIS